MKNNPSSLTVAIFAILALFVIPGGLLCWLIGVYPVIPQVLSILVVSAAFYFTLVGGIGDFLAKRAQRAARKAKEEEERRRVQQ